jgi:hypothetical protein
MAKIVITGKDKYIDYLSKHLWKEHPSTRKRMRVARKRRGKTTKK